MSETVLHKDLSTVPDDVNDRLIRPSSWNKEHKFSGGSHGYFLMRDTTTSDGASFQNLYTTFNAIDLSKPPYSVDMTGTVDATAIINDAINTQGNGARFVFPQGIVKISGSIIFDNKRGVTLTGAFTDTQFRWYGASNLPMFQFTGCFECGLDSLAIAAQNLLNIAVQCDTRVGSTSRANTFMNLYIDGTGNLLNYGFVTIPGTGGNVTNDLMKYTNCTVVNYIAAAFAFLHNNSISNTLINCTWLANGIGSYGVLAAAVSGTTITGLGGTFSSYNCSGGGNLLSDYYINAPGEATIIGGHLSGSRRLLICDDVAGTHLQSCPVLIEGVRWEDDNINGDGYAIYFRETGPLVLLKNIIGTIGSGRNVRIYMFSPNTTVYGPGGSNISIGNTYQIVSGSPFAQDPMSVSMGDVWLGNQGVTYINNLYVLPLVLTANLPAPSLAQSGRMYIEDGGSGNRNLIIYGQDERFRIDGGAAF